MQRSVDGSALGESAKVGVLAQDVGDGADAPEERADETVAPPARRVVARADARQNAVVPVSYRIVPDAGAQCAPEPDGSALFLVGLLGVAAIARRRLMP